MGLRTIVEIDSAVHGADGFDVTLNTRLVYECAAFELTAIVSDKLVKNVHLIKFICLKEIFLCRFCHRKSI